MDVEERYQRLSDEFQLKDKERELSLENRRRELEAKYEIKLNELRKTELALENTKVELETNFRTKLERLRDEDVQQLRDQKIRLEQYFSKLNDKFQKMVEQHKRQQDAEGLAVMERARQTAERQAAEEVQKREEFLKVQHAHENELLSALASLRDQISTMEGQHKATRAEILVLHTNLVEKEREYAKREGDLIVSNSKELGEQAIRLSAEITTRDSQIGGLRKELALKERDARVLEEQMRTKAEVEIQIKYLKLQQEFEQSVFAEAETRKESLSHQLAQAREELAKKEREMMDQLLKLRKEQELEIAQKRIVMEKEANDRYQKLQNEMFENERKRDIEKAVLAADMEEKHEKLARKLEEEFQLRQEKLDKQLVEKERKVRAEFRELEKNIELDKASFTVQLQQQYDHKLRELEGSMAHFENEKLTYAQNLTTKFDKLRKEDSTRVDNMKKRLMEYEQQLMDEFQKLNSEHTRLVENEGAERYRSLRDALHTANTRDTEHSDTLAKYHAAQDAEVAAALARLKDQTRELELRAMHAQDEANVLRTRLAEFTAQHQTQLADQSAAFNTQISELRAMLTAEVAARDRRVAQLSEQLTVQEREGETQLAKHKQDVEHKIARKYEQIHKDMRQQLLAELSDALEDREKLLREQEEAMRKDEMEMLKRMHQMQDDIVAADRLREHDRTKYKVELDQQHERRIRQAERELQQAKEAFESELMVKHQKLQTELLEKDRERDQQKEGFRREIMKRADEKSAELREQETILQKERMDYESTLRDKYDRLKREDQSLIQEERKRLEEYEKDIFNKFQITTTEYRRKVDEESKERIHKEKEDMEVRATMLAELKQKKAEFDREMSYRQQKMQDELLERERVKEADFLQKQMQLEEKYQQKTAELREIQLRTEVAKRDFELQIIQKFEKSWDDSTQHLKNQRKQLEEFHVFLLGKFQHQLREHQSHVAVAAQDHAVQLAHQAQQLANSHDETIAEVARYKRETDASLRGLRDRISVMDEECAALVAEVAAEKATQLTQRVEMQQEKDAKMREYEEVLTNLRQELQAELLTREEHVRVLEEQVAKFEDQRTSWELRTRAEIERHAAAAQREAYKAMEERLANEAAQTRKAHEEIAHAREANLQQQETILLAKIKKLREEMETEFVRRRGEMEKEKFSRMQLLQEEYQQKETERDTEKSEYFKELEKKYEERLKQLREREKVIDNEKITFERQVLENYMAQKEDDLKAMREEKQQWDQRDQEIHHNFVKSMDEFKRQLETDAKERAELWERLLQHDELELELSRQKEGMEQVFIKKHQKLLEENAEREAEISQQKSQYMKNIDTLLDQKTRALREKEEKLEKEKQEYESNLREAHDKRQEDDKAILTMHRQRLLDYEKNLYEKFQKMVENQTTMLEQEFEERQTRQHNVIKAWSEETLTQQRDQRRQQSEVERGYEESIKMLHEHIQELEARTQEASRTLARMEAETIINTSNLTTAHHQELLSITRQSQSLKGEADKTSADNHRTIIGLQETIAALNREGAERRDLAELQIETILREEYDKAQATREKNLLDQVAALHHNRHEQHMKERIQFENDLRLHYEQLQLDSESIRPKKKEKWGGGGEEDGVVVNSVDANTERIREWITDVVGQYAEKGHAARAQMETATRSSIESMISARLGAEEGMREEWDKFTRTIHQKYETLLTGLQGELVGLRKQEEERKLGNITGEEGEFHKQMAMEKVIQDKYEKILRVQQESWTEQKRELEEQLRANIHQGNMTLVDLERTYTQQKIAFEQELRNKYAQLIAEHQATTELIQKQSLAQEVEQMQSKMQLEQDRTRAWEEVEKRCRAEYQEQYTQLLADVEAHWKKDAGTREARVHAQLKQHYETLISTKQQQIDLLMQLNHDVDQAERVHWQQAVNELKLRHTEIIRDMDDKIKAKYDTLLKEYDKQYQQQLQQFTDSALAKGAGGDRLAWEKKLRRCKAAFTKWKFDYQVQTQAKYESILSDLHAKYGNQYNNMAQAVAVAKEKEIEASVSSRQKEAEMIDQIEQTTAATLAPIFAKHVGGGNEGRVAVLKAGVERLWDALGTDHEERQRFFNSLHQASPYADKVIQIYENELNRLNDKLQLMQTVTRREFVKHRLECLTKYEASSQESVILQEELGTLTNQLRIGLPTYQRQHLEPFLYKNHLPYTLD